MMRWLAYKRVDHVTVPISCSGVGVRGASTPGAMPYREYHYSSSITVRYRVRVSCDSSAW